MHDQLSKIKTRIQALLAKANSSQHPEEADAFLAKANELLQSYQLDASDLVDDNDPIAQHIGMTVAKSGHAWRWKLYIAVGALYGCRSVISRTYGQNAKGSWGEEYSITLVGKESSILTADLMTPWITQQVREQAKAVAKVTGMSEQGQAKRVAAALITRIYRLVAANKVDAPSTPAGRNALVLLDQVEAYFDNHFGNLSTMKARASVSDRLSREAAGNIGLHRQTGHVQTLKLS